MMRKLAGFPGSVFVLVVAWKLALLVFTSQPIPLSDSFFYDGAVVNALNGGGYCNPSLELVLPISGTKVFSAYPPLYQGALWGWMTEFGTDVRSAMWLHLVLFVVYGLAVLAVFRELATPARWVNFGSLFLFGVTFQDRPDSLAMACGCWAMFGWLRAGREAARVRRNAWHGLGAMLNVLTLATSLQIGLAFLGWSWLLVLAESRLRRRPVPWPGLLATVLVPAVLVVGVRGGAPLLWQGFCEHLAQTPTLMGWHSDNAAGLFKSQVLRLLRTSPGILFAMLCFAGLCARMSWKLRALISDRDVLFVATTFVASGGLAFCAVGLLMTGVIPWLTCLQPLAVGLTLAAFERPYLPAWSLPWLGRGFILLAFVVGVRAIALSVGAVGAVASAADSSASGSLGRVRAAIASSPRGSTVVLSAAYLYEANRHREVRSLHADWLGSYREGASLLRQLAEVKPDRLVLTPYDWYRRFKPVMAELGKNREAVELKVTDTARLRPDDMDPRLQKLIQRVSWSPVVVEFDWKQPMPAHNSNQSP